MVTSQVRHISVASFRGRVGSYVCTLQFTIRLLLKKNPANLGFFHTFFFVNFGIVWAIIDFNVVLFCGDLLTSVERDLW